MSQMDVPLKDAVELLTVGELGWIKKAFGRSFEDLDGIETLTATVLMHERRRALAAGTEVPGRQALDEWTMRRLNDYFPPEAVEVDEDDPETEQGKAVSPDA